MVVTGLKKETDCLLDKALASSTKKVYTNQVNKFIKFCTELKLGLPGGYRDGSVELWLSKLRKEGAAYSTIRSHLSALRHHCIRYDIEARLDSSRIRLLLKGIKRDSGEQASKAAVTISHLKRLIDTSRRILDLRRHTKFEAMATVAFFGFLRPSEFCVTKAGHYIKWKNVKFSKRGNDVKIALSSFKHSTVGGLIYLNSRESSICPVECLKRYRKKFEGAHGEALFEITLEEFQKTLEMVRKGAGIRTLLTPHCFRHGGATWAGKQGWTDARIRTHGRWKSDAFKKYVRPT